MKKSLAFVVVLAACAPKVTTTTTTAPVGGAPAPAPAPTVRATSSATGGATPRVAVQSFLDAIRAQDIQAMSVLFGTSRGPSRDNMSRDELEKRLVILQCYFSHDSARFLGETQGTGGHRLVQFALTRGSITRSPSFYTIEGPNGRWYIDNMEIVAVRDLQARPCN